MNPYLSSEQAIEHKEQSTLSKLREMAHGHTQLFRPEEMDVLRVFDSGRAIKFRKIVYYEAWIQEKDRRTLLGHLPQLTKEGNP